MNNALAARRIESSGLHHRRVIGIGEFMVSNVPAQVLATHAVGSCITVCIFDPAVRVAGMLHFLLPESSINPARAQEQPAVFADTGIPLLFQTAYDYGLSKRRAIVKIVGGAEMPPGGQSGFNTGRRNAMAARNLLWRNGIFLSAEDVGGALARTVHLSVGTGRLQIFSGQTNKEL